jgi:hypothetical protein
MAVAHGSDVLGLFGAVGPEAGANIGIIARGSHPTRRMTGVLDWPFGASALLATCQSVAQAVAVFVLESGSAWTAFITAGLHDLHGRT